VLKTFKTMADSDISSLRFMLGTFRGEKLQEQRKMMVATACSKYKLTYSFVQEFIDYITPDSFSTSPDLTYEMIKSFSNLFNAELWVGKDVNEKSLEPLHHSEFIKTYGEEIIEKAFRTVHLEKVTKEIFNQFKDKLTDETKKYVINGCNFVKEEDIIDYIDYIDYKFVNSRNVKINFSNSLIEKIIENKQLTMRLLISLLSKSNDIEFVANILKKNLNIVESGDTFDSELNAFVLRLPEENMGFLFDLLVRYNKNSLSYSMLSRLLTVKDFLSEEFLLQYIDIFKDNAVIEEVIKYARFKEYNNILLALKLTE
jgi:hypothetical protein